ncbi:zinc finger protein 774-like isoform X1 [Drosophila novamexicana]|uniref:zinc finger protein 774-like isoform X1 n=1 Tax=Drosophila novamexicana TaxID=47314 RepID=UPI0011E5D078|nr:zinc finger protein 774-like isoform X1 [Drosophila novamexicana]
MEDMDVCRVCMARESGPSVKLINIFDWSPEVAVMEDDMGIGSTRLDDMLNECTNCEVKLDDELPKKICMRCVIDAQQAFKFRRLCNHTYHFFCQLLSERRNTSSEMGKNEHSATIRRQTSNTGEVLATTIADRLKSMETRCLKMEEDDGKETNVNLRTHDRLDIRKMDLGPIKLENELRSKTIENQDTQQGELNCMDEHGGKAMSSSIDRPYKCPHCSKAFAQNQHLKRHIFGHMGKRPYKCPHCPKDFAQSHHLKRHVCTHTGQPFKCPHCSKAFSLNHLLAEHIRVHTGERPFKCPHCPKSFTQNPYLTAHIRRHKGERPYQCPQCSKAFGLNHILQTHIRGHKGERPHQCAHCLKAFTQKCNLKMHQRRCPATGANHTKLIENFSNCPTETL